MNSGNYEVPARILARRGSTKLLVELVVTELSCYFPAELHNSSESVYLYIYEKVRGLHPKKKSICALGIIYNIQQTVMKNFVRTSRNMRHIVWEKRAKNVYCR